MLQGEAITQYMYMYALTRGPADDYSALLYVGKSSITVLVRQREGAGSTELPVLESVRKGLRV